MLGVERVARIRTLLIATLIATLVFLVSTSLVSAGTHVDLSLHQYQRFEPAERFQTDTRIHVYHKDAAYQFGVEYSLFEAIHGPISDHTLNLFELYWTRGPVTLSSLLVNDGPYDKVDPYHDAMLEARVNLQANLPWKMSGWSFEWIPAVRMKGSEAWRPLVSLGASARRKIGASTLEFGVNNLGPRDYYLVSEAAATARIRVPLWNGNQFFLEYGRQLGQSSGPVSQWWTWRLEMASLFEF